ncbi:MAG: Nif3-like dinuclear metal center hexameric protein [Oscillospiraceae bacterium]|nr:Nif3-like dinuclear metal center hexameric protein [Oscillospiraceae bacterium]
MVTVREIEQFLFAWAPKETAASWDNVGHLVGEQEQKVERVLVALDITPDVIREAIDGTYDLIVSHHPFINCAWNPVQTIRGDDQQGRGLIDLIRARVSAICMHTNLDIAQGGVNDVLAAKLGLTQTEVMAGGDGIVRVGVLEKEFALPEFLSYVREQLKPNGIRFADGGRKVCRVAVGGGACGEYFRAAAACGCDTFVTSDVKYNQFLDAKELGLNLIDAGHYPTEDGICSAIAQRLSEKFPGLTIQKSTSHQEVIQYYI